MWDILQVSNAENGCVYIDGSVGAGGRVGAECIVFIDCASTYKVFDAGKDLARDNLCNLENCDSVCYFIGHHLEVSIYSREIAITAGRDMMNCQCFGVQR